MPDSIGDRLLYAVSAWRQTSWGTFAEAVDQIAVQSGTGKAAEPIKQVRRAAIQALDALGHIDAYFSPEGSRVVAAPPILAGLPAAGFPRAILCGARSPGTAGQVRSLGRASGVTITVRSGANPYAPSRIEVEASSRGAIAEFAARLNVGYAVSPPAIGIAAVSCSIDEYLASLSWFQEVELGWGRRDFDPRRLEFRPDAEEGPLRLSRYEDPVRIVPRFRLCRDGECAWVDPRWARYLAIRAAGTASVVYESTWRRVLVPRAAPLPRLLARALALCIGEAPRMKRSESSGSRAFDVYEGVPPDVFDLVASKLGLAKN